MFKNNWIYDDLLLLSSLFQLFYFMFSASCFCFISVCFPVSQSFFLGVLSQAFIEHSRKALVYIYIVCIIHIF